jgi:hypothetical protein
MFFRAAHDKDIWRKIFGRIAFNVIDQQVARDIDARIILKKVSK